VRFYFQQGVRIVTWLIGGIAIYLASLNLRGERGVVVLGATDWTFSDKVNIPEIQKEQFLNTADKLLGGYSTMFEFETKVIGKPYSNLVAAILNDRVDMGTISPYTFLYHHYNDSIQIRHRLRFVGAKYLSSGQTYFPGFIINSSRHESLDSILQKNAKTKFLLSSERLSTSTRVIPLLLLIEKGLDDQIEGSLNVDRRDMLKRIKTDKCGDTTYVGVMTDDQWEALRKAKDDTELTFLRLDSLEVPYDPVMVNVEHWEKRFKNPFDTFIDFIMLRTFPYWRDREEVIFDALREMMAPRKENEEWVENMGVFKDRVASWIVGNPVSNQENWYYLYVPVGENGHGYDFDSTKECLPKSEIESVDVKSFQIVKSGMKKGFPYYSNNYQYYTDFVDSFSLCFKKVDGDTIISQFNKIHEFYDIYQVRTVNLTPQLHPGLHLLPSKRWHESKIKPARFFSN